jgi:hypothetical protein
LNSLELRSFIGTDSPVVTDRESGDSGWEIAQGTDSRMDLLFKSEEGTKAPVDVTSACLSKDDRFQEY